MPLSSIQQLSPETLLGRWDLQEPAEALLAQFKAIAPPDLLLPTFGSASRQQQWLAGRLLTYTLLAQMGAAQARLLALPGGKPYFDQPGLHLSISHTRQQVVALVSRAGSVGIDIEGIHPKVLRVKDKFLTASEQGAAGEDLNKTLIYWCTKETLFKLYGRRQIIFKEHLKVAPFDLQPSGFLTASIGLPDFQKTYTVHYEVGTDFILTYCLDHPA